MSLVCVSLGSNVEPAAHIRRGFEALGDTFGAVRVSRVFESEPVGLDGEANFYNAVAAFESDWSPGALHRWAKALEAVYAQGPTPAAHAPKALDIDLLCVGQLSGEVEGITLPRPDITRYAFVLTPLAELLPDARHPACGTPYRTLLQRAAFGHQRLWPVALD